MKVEGMITNYDDVVNMKSETGDTLNKTNSCLLRNRRISPHWLRLYQIMDHDDQMSTHTHTSPSNGAVRIPVCVVVRLAFDTQLHAISTIKSSVVSRYVEFGLKDMEILHKKISLTRDNGVLCRGQLYMRFLQMAHVFTSISQLHIPTAFHFFISMRLSGSPPSI